MYKQTLVLVTLLAITAALLAGAVCAWADNVPQIVNYQGRLKNAGGSPVADGTYGVVFTVYDSAAGGTSIWTETQRSVTVAGGAFHVLLGSTSPLGASVFPAGADRWLGVKVGEDAELSPRQKIASVPFALRADTLAPAAVGTTELSNSAVTSAKIAGGAVGDTALATGAVTETKLADGSVSAAKVANSAIGSAKLSSDASSLSKVSGGAMTVLVGSVGVGTAAPGSQLTVRRATAGDALTVRNTDDTANTLVVSDAGSLSASAGAFTGGLSANVLTVNENSSPPSNPASGKGTIYEDSAQNAFLLTSSGTKKYLNTNITTAEQTADVSCYSATRVLVDITGAQLSLTAGTYLILAHFYGRIWLNPGDCEGFYYGGIFYSDNTLIKDAFNSRRVTGSTSRNEQTWDLWTTVTLASAKTIKLRGCTYGAGANFASGFAIASNNGETSDRCRLLAIKISE